MNTLNFRNDKKWLIVAITALLIVAPENFGKSSKETVPNSPKHSFHTQGNPYLPLWEHVRMVNPVSLKIQTIPVNTVFIS